METWLEQIEALEAISQNENARRLFLQVLEPESPGEVFHALHRSLVVKAPEVNLGRFDLRVAHQPLERYPEIIRRAAREVGGAAQYAGGVPAMCDGVTQGRPGMELSLFSRDVTRRPFVTDTVINTDYDPSRMQVDLFIAPSLTFLRRELEELVRRFGIPVL